MASDSGASLNVWMNGKLVGNWKISRGIHQFVYADSWYEYSGRRPVSLSLPLHYPGYRHTGTVVEHYFDNLLPDSFIIRSRLQSRFRTPTAKIFDLLYEAGRDCVGAVQLLPPEYEAPDMRRIDGKKVDDEEMEAILKSVPSNDSFRILDTDDFRISLAGAQEKTAFTRYRGRWLKAHGSTPSTHIFKLPLGHIGQDQLDLSSSLENEWLCARIFEQCGLPVAASEIALFGSIKTHIVERFDRKLVDKKWFLRIPQEDFCQLTGKPSELKYEANGGPGIKNIMDVLLGSLQSQVDRRNFFTAQILFLLLAAPDGHAKNFSVFIEQEGRYKLTPFYDIMSAFPVLGKTAHKISPSKLKMAMAFPGKNRHYTWRSITRGHILQTGKACGLSDHAVNSILDEILENAAAAVENVSSVLPVDFPAETAGLIFEGFLSSVKSMKNTSAT